MLLLQTLLPSIIAEIKVCSNCILLSLMARKFQQGVLKPGPSTKYCLLINSFLRLSTDAAHGFRNKCIPNEFTNKLYVDETLCCYHFKYMCLAKTIARSPETFNLSKTEDLLNIHMIIMNQVSCTTLF